MASNFFGQIFRITTFGESHGPAIGVVIDGCPAGLSISSEEIDHALSLRSPGKSPFTSPRQESDQVQILSGILDGCTTGAPIALLIPNSDVDSSSYETTQHLYRPGHANFTYLQKYGIFDERGSGRASGRETAARVAAGAIAKKLLKHFQIEAVAYISEIGGIAIPAQNLRFLRKRVEKSPIFCPDASAEKKMIKKIQDIQKEKDSIGGIVTCIAHIPAGLGDPVYGKLSATLASAMLSIPAAKGFEIGSGFAAARMKGSEHNDPFIVKNGRIQPETNHAGGLLGGISTGDPLICRVAFKPTSSIKQEQKTVDKRGKKAILKIPDTARHDPCIAIRAVLVVEAMAAICIADALLQNQSSRLGSGVI